MKKTILFLSIGLLLAGQAIADTRCFLAKENDQVIKREGECNLRQTPCSTFKIPISFLASSILLSALVIGAGVYYLNNQ